MAKVRKVEKDLHKVYLDKADEFFKMSPSTPTIRPLL
jgi:hypothetical protein